jgi:cation diffusion facilitator family transporter
MHTHSTERWQHSHAFLGERHERHERRTWIVVALTAVMMVGEIVGGHAFGSLALVADGWHMSTHAAALGIAGLAYLFARRHKEDARFTLGTGKFGDLAAFASAIILGMIALAIEAITRLQAPVSIAFPEAIAIATLGLAVNLVSAWLLRDDHDHAHHHEHADHRHEPAGHHHHHVGADLNLRAAYVHVLADALTSVLAIAGLIAAWSLNWLSRSSAPR